MTNTNKGFQRIIRRVWINLKIVGLKLKLRIQRYIGVAGILIFLSAAGLWIHAAIPSLYIEYPLPAIVTESPVYGDPVLLFVMGTVGMLLAVFSL